MHLTFAIAQELLRCFAVFATFEVFSKLFKRRVNQKIQAGFLLNMVIASSYELTIDGTSIGSVDIYSRLPLSRERKGQGFSVDAL